MASVRKTNFALFDLSQLMKSHDLNNAAVVSSLHFHRRHGVECLLRFGLQMLPGRGGMFSQEEKTESTPLLLAFAPLHRLALGVASGIVLGALLFVATLDLLIRDGYPEPNLNLLAQFLWGYSISWRGLFIGLVWGFGIGFGLGWIFALIRNAVSWIWLTVIRSRAEMEHYSDFLDHL
jgi:hypothetical protein